MQIQSLMAQAVNRPSRPSVTVPVQPGQPILPVSGDQFQLRFSGILNQDYSVELRSTESIGPSMLTATLKGLQTRHWIKAAQGDTSTLKLFTDTSGSEGFTDTNRGTFGDMLALMNRLVDVIIKHSFGDVGLKALLMTHGKRLMQSGGILSLGPIQHGAPYKRNDDHQIRRELNNEYVRDLEYLIMSRTGIADRQQVNQDLTDSTNFNAMQALHYGTKGLIDGILTGHDDVITREDMNRYFSGKKMNPKQISAFMQNYNNVYKLPTRKLAEWSPQSIPTPPADKEKKPLIPRPSWYSLPKDKIAAQNAAANPAPAPATPGAPAPAAPPVKEPPKEPEGGLMFYHGDKAIKPQDVGLNLKVRAKDLKADRTYIEGITTPRTLLEDDLIFFDHGFEDKTAEQVSEALLALDEKKAQQPHPSHIKIFVNSPGGAISSGMEIRSTIESLKTPVDVIVTGMAASCGAFLVASATGNRFITPNAKIMIHDALWELNRQPTDHYNEKMDYLDNRTKGFVGAIANAADRPFKAVWEDMKVDMWLNPLESMFYGNRGLADGILVGPQTVIHKEDVQKYLAEELGNDTAVDRYVADRLKSLRNGSRVWRPADHNEKDPFDNPLKTIEAVARKYGRPLEQIPSFKDSVPRAGTSIDYFTTSEKSP